MCDSICRKRLSGIALRFNNHPGGVRSRGHNLSTEPNFGPYRSYESVAAFDALSEQSFAILDERTNAESQRLTRPVHHLFIRIGYQAKTTSLAARLTNSWALSLPALALVRVRLEQTIICSFLTHEQEESGLRPFVSYIPIGHYKNLKAALDDPELVAELSRLFDVGRSESEALKAQQELTPGFSLESDKFQRNWTKLDLRSMAKRRDALVVSKTTLQKESLEREYLSFYKVASSVVHADCSSLSYAFLDTFQAPSTKPVLMALPSWALIVAVVTAHYDLLQCYEILQCLDIDAEKDYEALSKRWAAARDRFVRDPET